MLFGIIILTGVVLLTVFFFYCLFSNKEKGETGHGLSVPAVEFSPEDIYFYAVKIITDDRLRKEQKKELLTYLQQIVDLMEQIETNPHIPDHERYEIVKLFGRHMRELLSIFFAGKDRDIEKLKEGLEILIREAGEIANLYESSDSLEEKIKFLKKRYGG